MVAMSRDRITLRILVTGFIIVGLTHGVSEGKTFDRFMTSQEKSAADERYEEDSPPSFPSPAARQGAHGSPGCVLVPWDPDLPKQLKKMAVSRTVHLVKYELVFNEYPSSPLISKDNTTFYKADVWYRTFTTHGRRLLTMAFNYEALSLSLLKFGVKKLKVNMVDTPPMCFGRLKEAEKMSAVLKLLLWDLETDSKQTKDAVPWESDKDYICHQVIEDDDGKAKLVFKCCSRGSSANLTQCAPIESDDVIEAFYVILGLMKIGFVLFGPIVLQRIIFEGSTKKASYVVPIEGERLTKTILVKKVRAAVDDESTSSGFGRRKDMKQFTRFRKLVKTIPSETIVPVTFNRLDVLVDHKELMTENGVPVGLFRFIYDTFIRCGITRVEPLKSCCQESIFGSWSPRFLWLKLRKRCDCNRGCRESCSWASIFNFLGVVVLIFIIPFPYYIRLIGFYSSEEDEVEDRQDAFDRLDLNYKIDHNIIQSLTPTHASLIILYITYLTSALLLSALRICDSSKIDGIARACVTDMRHIRQSECLRMLCAHILLPFEKFGVFGVLVALLYWPVILPLCILVCIFYCVPLVYLTGRLLVNYRPGCCRRKPLPSPGGAQPIKSISGGVTSFDSCFFLDTISPNSRPYSSVISGTEATKDANKRPRQKNVLVYRQKLASGFGTFLVGLLMLLGVYSVLVMYAEAFGFLVEVCVHSTLGAIVNSDESVQYVILAFWGIVYTVASCKLSYVGYARLSRQLFSFINRRLGVSIQSASLLRQEKRRNTAFKYFNCIEAAELKARDLANIWLDECDGATSGQAGRTSEPVRHDAPLDRDDTIEYRDNRLHWTINSLVLFVDKNDVSRIPLDFFWEICKLDMPGSPGPVHKAALRAVCRILGSMIFLALLAVVILSFGNMYELTTPNQMLLMLVSGGIPLIVFLALYRFRCPSRSQINEYSLYGKVQRVILGYCQSWPVYDLSFLSGTATSASAGGSRRDDSRYRDHNQRSLEHDCVDSFERRQQSRTEDATTELKSMVNGNRRDDVTSGSSALRNLDSMQVDLLITVKDDQEDDNIRSEPVSLGSRMSINSNSRVDRTSPDEGHPVSSSQGTSQGIQNQPTTSCVTNQPTNATRSRMTESAEALQEETEGAFALRKQSSVSTLPVQNHVASTATQADMVVDLTDDVMFVKRIGFASPRNTVSMRSLPSYKHRSTDSTNESAL